MARPRLPMRQFRQIFRLKHEAGLSNRAIARACPVGLGTVSNYLRRAAEAGLSWQEPAGSCQLNNLLPVLRRVRSRSCHGGHPPPQALNRPRNRGNSTPRRRLRSAPIDRVMRAARTIITLDKRVRVVIGGS